MRIIMIDDNGHQSDITQEVQNIIRGNQPVASDREQQFMPRQMAYGHQRPMRPQVGQPMPHAEQPMPQGGFMPQGGQRMPQGGFMPQGGQRMPQGQFIPVPVDEFGNPMDEIPEGEQFGGFIGGNPYETPVEFNGQAQVPVYQRPVMTRRPMMGRPQPQGGFRPQVGSPRFSQEGNFEEQAHRFAERMTRGMNRQGVPAQGERRIDTPHYRRNF